MNYLYTVNINILKNCVKYNQAELKCTCKMKAILIDVINSRDCVYLSVKYTQFAEPQPFQDITDKEKFWAPTNFIKVIHVLKWTNPGILHRFHSPFTYYYKLLPSGFVMLYSPSTCQLSPMQLACCTVNVYTMKCHDQTRQMHYNVDYSGCNEKNHSPSIQYQPSAISSLYKNTPCFAQLTSEYRRSNDTWANCLRLVQWR